MWDHFLGSLNDQTILFWFAWWRDSYSSFSGNYIDFSFMYGSPIGWVVNYFPNQWLIWGFYFFLAKFTAPIFAFNLLAVLSTLLIIIVSYFYFRTHFTKSISLISAFLYLFSTYSIYKVTNHIDLFQLWVIPLFVLVHNKYLRAQTRINLYLCAITVALITFISNYYAFFLLLYVASVMLFKLFTEKQSALKIKFIKDSILFFVCYLLLVMPVLLPFYKTSATDSILDTGNKVNRPIDDYVTFSARPWNYILPSTQNPLLGMQVLVFNNWLENKNYFLFNNYFPKEHGAIYLGIGNFILLLFGIVLLLKKILPEPHVIVQLLAVTTILLLFSLPPFFTISGIKIFMPSYLIYKIIPVFRVISRLFVIIYLLVLTVNGYTLSVIQSKLSKVNFGILLAFLLFVHIATSYVTINVTDLSKTPEIYTYIRDNTAEDSTIAVYPYSKTNEFLFWMKEHRRGFFNPREYCNLEYCSEEVTKHIPTIDGLQTLRHYGVSYILVSEPQNLTNFETLISNGNLSIINQLNHNYLLQIN